MTTTRRPDVVFGVAAGLLEYDDATFDDVDPRMVAMFEGR